MTKYDIEHELDSNLNKTAKFPVTSIKTGEEYLIEISIKHAAYFGKYVDVKLKQNKKKKFLFMSYEKFEVLFDGTVPYKKFINEEYTFKDIAEDVVLQYEYEIQSELDYNKRERLHISKSIQQFNDWDGTVNQK